MGTKWLRYDAAKKNPNYVNLVAQCLVELSHVQSFRKDTVIAHKTCKLEPFADTIRWDYVVRMLEEHEDVGDSNLIPVSASFFKRHPKAEEKTNPGRFLAAGYSAKTAGFVLVCQKHSGMVLEYVKMLHNRIYGNPKSKNGKHTVPTHGAVGKVKRLANNVSEKIEKMSPAQQAMLDHYAEPTPITANAGGRKK